MFTPSNPAIKYEIRDHVAWVGLNRPDQMNALNYFIRQALGEAMIEAGRDDSVWAVILYGEGRAFCAGNDLKEVSEADSRGEKPRRGYFGAEEVSACPKPVIAAIDGYAVAGGMQLAARCDIRVATERSRFGMPEARRSLMPEHTDDTPDRYLPLGEALFILLTGSTQITAERCYQLGFVQSLVPDREAMLAEAERIAGEIKLCAPLAVQAIKYITTQGRYCTPEVALKLGLHLRERVARSEDRREGPRAFAEKRTPQWKGR